MKDWIEEQRGTIIRMAKEGLLSTQISGPLTRQQEDRLDEYVDKMVENAPLIDENFDEMRERTGDTEILASYSAELVYYADKQLIEDFLSKAVGAHSIDFNELQKNKKASFVGDYLMNIVTTISDIVDGFSDGENFILCSPLEISILQSVGRNGEFKMAEDGAWKGPNYSSLVGYLNKVKLYSHLNRLPYDNDIVFVGNYNPETVKTTIHKIVLINLSLA